MAITMSFLWSTALHSYAALHFYSAAPAPERGVVVTEPQKLRGDERFTDLGYHVGWSRHPHHIEFAVYEIVPGCSHPIGLMLADEFGIPVGTKEEAEVVLSGFVKYDGALHFTSDRYISTMSRKQTEHLGELLWRIHDLATVLLIQGS